MRFVELVERQLALFREDYADVIDACRAAERAYDRAPREEAEERYAAYLELVEECADALGGIRDAYAATLDAEAADEYSRLFDKEVGRRLPGFSLGL